MTSYPNSRSAKTLTLIIYALQAASFFIGFTFIVAIIFNYVKRDDVQGTWLASHFTWQIRTFWFSLVWGVLGAILIYVMIGYVILFCNFIWVIYRIAKGWLRLNSRQAMYS